jgi:hypothetical protein
VSDRIELTLGVSESVRRQVQPFIDELARETLAQSLHWGQGASNATLDEEDIYIGVVRVDMPPR